MSLSKCKKETLEDLLKSKSNYITCSNIKLHNLSVLKIIFNIIQQIVILKRGSASPHYNTNKLQENLYTIV